VNVSASSCLNGNEMDFDEKMLVDVFHENTCEKDRKRIREFENILTILHARLSEQLNHIPVQDSIYFLKKLIKLLTDE
jgi:hypothetical protein